MHRPCGGILQCEVQVFKGQAKQKASLAWTWLSTLFTPTQQTLSVKDLDHSKSLSAGSLTPWMYVIWTRWLKVRRTKLLVIIHVAASLLHLPSEVRCIQLSACCWHCLCCLCTFCTAILLTTSYMNTVSDDKHVAAQCTSHCHFQCLQQLHCDLEGRALQRAHSTHQDIQLQIEFADLDER